MIPDTYLVNMLMKVWMVCSVNGTPIWTRNPWKSARKKPRISSVTSAHSTHTYRSITAQHSMAQRTPESELDGMFCVA